jgi:ATP-binding cassette subfamily B protein
VSRRSALAVTAERPLTRLLHLAWQHRGRCVIVLTSQVVLLGLGVAGLGLVGLGVDVMRHVLDPSTVQPRWPGGFAPPTAWEPPVQLAFIAAMVLAMASVRGLISFWYAIAVGRLVHLNIVPNLRTQVFNKIQRLSFRFYDEHASGSIINRITGDVQSVRAFIDGVLLQGGILLLSLVVYLVYMLRTHVGLTLACMIFTPLLWVLATLFSRWAQPAYRRTRELVDHVVLAMTEGVRGVEVTKTFGREAEDLRRFQRKTAAVEKHQRHVFRGVSVFTPAVSFVTNLNTAVLLLYGGSLASRGALTLGDLIVFAGLFQQLSGQIASMAAVVNTLQQSLAAARRVFEILDAPIEIRSPARPRRLGALRGHIQFEHVDFGYQDDAPVLKDVSFEVRPGQTLAIVGLTGSGKSTLLSLVPRFYDPLSGRVLIDGHDVRELELDEMRRGIGVVFQESLLFSVSVAENIAFGHPDARREAIERAARIAGADGFVRELPDGYDTVLAEGAVTLSGGQRQRIAIARALLLEPPVLLLDDPTTAVDPETEHEVLGAMEEAMRGRTSLVVANRLATLRRADSILVLENGQIVERGTHEQLMGQRGRYFHAASLQAADEASAELLRNGEGRA